MTSANPEFWMPISKVSARRVDENGDKATPARAPVAKATALWTTTMAPSIGSAGQRTGKKYAMP